MNQLLDFHSDDVSANWIAQSNNYYPQYAEYFIYYSVPNYSRWWGYKPDDGNLER